MIGCSVEMLLEVLLRQFCCLYSSRIGSEGSSQGRTWTAHVTLSARGLSARFHRVWLPHFAANASLAAVATRKSCRNGCEWGLSVACALTGVLSCRQRGCLGNRCSQPRCVSGQFCVFQVSCRVPSSDWPVHRDPSAGCVFLGCGWDF